MRQYSTSTYWDHVGRELLKRSEQNDSTIASDDTPYYATKQRLFFEELLDPALDNARSILEVGPGPGGNLARITSPDKVVFGADVSPSMLSIARRRGFRLVRIDGARLPFGARTFGAVFTSTVLQHNTTELATRLLLEMARVSGDEVHLFEDTGPTHLRVRRSLWLRPPSWYESILTSAGFELTYEKRLPLSCQEVAATIARVLVDRDRAQGASATARRLRLEDRLLRFARPLDRTIPPMIGLTRMSFRLTS